MKFLVFYTLWWKITTSGGNLEKTFASLTFLCKCGNPLWFQHVPRWLITTGWAAKRSLLIVKPVWNVALDNIQKIGLSSTQQLTTWANTSLHLLLLKSSMIGKLPSINQSSLPAVQPLATVTTPAIPNYLISEIRSFWFAADKRYLSVLLFSSIELVGLSPLYIFMQKYKLELVNFWPCHT